MKKVQVQIPGKILLAGEYAVLSGCAALSVAIDRYLEVTLESSEQPGWIIQSNLWPDAYELHSEKGPLRANEPLTKVAAVAATKYGLGGIHCQVRSELDIRFGLGSSSALRLGVLMAADVLAHGKQSWDRLRKLKLASQVWQLQKAEQGFASGYDVLTQTLGGLVLWKPDYENWPGSAITELSPLSLSPWLTVMVGGQGAPTKIVGQSVRQAMQEKKIETNFNRASDHLLEAWLNFIQTEGASLPSLLATHRAHRNILTQLPYFPAKVFDRLSVLKGFDKSWTLKTTGAGGEDALLLLGAKKDTAHAQRELESIGWHTLSCSWNSTGVQLNQDKIL